MITLLYAIALPCTGQYGIVIHNTCYNGHTVLRVSYITVD